MYAVRILLVVASISHAVSFRWGFCPKSNRDRSLPAQIPGVLEFHQQNVTTERIHVKDSFTVNCSTNDPEAEVFLTKYLGSVMQLKVPVDNKKIFLEKQVFNVTNVQLHEFGCYACNARIKKGGKVHSIQQVMTQVLFLQDMEKPAIKEGSQHTLFYGSSANFTCSGQKFYQLQWVRCYNHTHQEAVSDDMTETVSLGKRKQGIVLKIKELREAWDKPVLYSCVISHKKKQLSAILNITIQEPKPPHEIEFSSYMITGVGNTFTVTCKARGMPRPTITFLRDNQEIRNCKDTGRCHIDGENYKIHNRRRNELDRSRSELEVVNPTQLNTGRVTCRADNGFGKPAMKTMSVIIFDEDGGFPGIP